MVREASVTMCPSNRNLNVVKASPMLILVERMFREKCLVGAKELS